MTRTLIIMLILLMAVESDCPVILGEAPASEQVVFSQPEKPCRYFCCKAMATRTKFISQNNPGSIMAKNGRVASMKAMGKKAGCAMERTVALKTK